MRQIEVTGYVDSLIPFYKAADVVVCPLRIGGRVKVKILEALKAGKAIYTQANNTTYLAALLLI
jgi:polysaccharide biosynthesis protein PslH